MSKELFRDKDNATIGGVCAGIARYFSMDVTLVRAIFLIALVGFGSGFILYLILWIVLPGKSVGKINHEADYTVKGDGNTPSPTEKKGRESIIGGLILITLGLIFLIDEFIPWFSFGKLWPLILIAIGIGLLWNNYARKNKSNENSKQE